MEANVENSKLTQLMWSKDGRRTEYTKHNDGCNWKVRNMNEMFVERPTWEDPAW
jgi:hypothetical protein